MRADMHTYSNRTTFFDEVKILKIWPNTLDYNPWFGFWGSEKILRKVCHSKGNEERSLMTFVSVA